MLKPLFFILVVIAALVLPSCSKRIMEAKETHKLHDEFFILRKNGRYSIKMMMMGVLRMPDSEHGRYVRSADTVYVVRKKSKNVFETIGYGIIDSTAGKFSYYPSAKNEARVFNIEKMLVRRSE